MALICDTGPLYAAMDVSDHEHIACAELLSGAREPLVVPAPVVVELDLLTGSRGIPQSFSAFLEEVVAGRVSVVDLVRQDYMRARELLVQYDDLPLGLVDASVVAMAERLGETKIATLDHRHFRVVRPRHVSSLTLLPHVNNA